VPGDLSQAVFPIARLEPQGMHLLGTAFTVGANKVGTALHTVGTDDRNLVLVLPRIASLHDYQDTANARVNSMSLELCAADPVRDLCVLQLPQEAAALCSYTLSSTDAVPTGTPVATFGFPHASSGRMVLTQQNTIVGARILIEAEGIKTKHIVLNTQARDGQSGSPVFNSTLTQVVAVILGSYAPPGAGSVIISGVNPLVLHQTTHAISAEYLKDMLA
jgi:Trypsin-like peptidase domain